MSDAPSPRPEIIGRYHVLRLLGQGAMGRVMLARDEVLDREVAVKVLRDDLGLPPDMRAALFDRMKNEAKAAARVSHPHLVTLHDMGEAEGLGVYLVFEYVPGATLRERIDRGALPAHEVARLARELGSALTTAHAARVVHRDVKPDNVLLAPNGAKITDFGIARIPDSTLTRAGSLIGTPAYCAPEALSRGQFSPASDQFSLAATLYEALSGERAFPGEDAVTVSSRIASTEASHFARRLGLDPRIDELLARALSKSPAARFPSCETFGHALADALEADAGPTATLPVAYDGGLVAPRAPRTTAVALAAALAGTFAGATLVALLRPADAGELAAAASPSASARTTRTTIARPRPRATAPRPSASASSDLPAGTSASEAPSAVAPSEPRDPSEPSEPSEAASAAAPSEASPAAASDAAASD
jgi:serine/threonine-protein kinase